VVGLGGILGDRRRPLVGEHDGRVRLTLELGERRVVSSSVLHPRGRGIKPGSSNELIRGRYYWQRGQTHQSYLSGIGVGKVF
jgi:hypothetical protein